MHNIDRFASDWMACRRAAFDRETLRLRAEAYSLFLFSLSASCAFASLLRLLL